MKKIAFTFLLFVCTSAFVFSQSHLQFGLLSGSNKLKDLTPDDFSHSGWRIGIDQKLGGVGVYFLGGIHYVRFNEEARDGTNFFDTDPAIQILKPRLGIGATPFAIGDLFKIRVKGLASYNYFLAFDGERANFDTDKIKSGYLNFDFGVGANIGMVTLDIEYELGLNGVIDDLDDSQFRFLSVAVGLTF